MPFPTLTYEYQLEEVTKQELKQLLAQLEAYLGVEHDSSGDGTHAHVTADSLTVIENAARDDDTGRVRWQDANGNASQIRRSVADGLVLTFETEDPETDDAIAQLAIDTYLSLGLPDVPSGFGVTGDGIGFNIDASNSGDDEEWVLTHGVDNKDAFFGLFNMAAGTGGECAFKLYHEDGNNRFILAPPDFSTHEHWLGDSGDTDWQWDEINGKIVRAATAYYERGRSFPIGEWQTDWTPTWASTIGTVAINGGGLVGRYMRVGRTTFFQLFWGAASTTNFGTAGGIWTFDLPVGERSVAPYGLVTVFASGMAYDADTGNRYHLTAYRHASDTIRMMIAGSPMTGPLAQGTPFTFADNDQISLSGWYEED